MARCVLCVDGGDCNCLEPVQDVVAEPARCPYCSRNPKRCICPPQWRPYDPVLTPMRTAGERLLSAIDSGNPDDLVARAAELLRMLDAAGLLKVTADGGYESGVDKIHATSASAGDSCTSVWLELL